LEESTNPPRGIDLRVFAVPLAAVAAGCPPLAAVPCPVAEPAVAAVVPAFAAVRFVVRRVVLPLADRRVLAGLFSTAVVCSWAGVGPAASAPFAAVLVLFAVVAFFFAVAFFAVLGAFFFAVAFFAESSAAAAFGLDVVRLVAVVRRLGAALASATSPDVASADPAAAAVAFAFVAFLRLVVVFGAASDGAVSVVATVFARVVPVRRAVRFRGFVAVFSPAAVASASAAGPGVSVSGLTVLDALFFSATGLEPS
jgi:hypothetical protein